MPPSETDAASIPEVADLALIRKILPHRYPFLMVDRVQDIVPNVSAVGIKCVTANEPQFTGHFPGNPVMPGVLMIEAMAQTSGVLIGVSRGLASTLMMFFATVDKAKFRRVVGPGDVLEMHVTAKRVGTKVGKFEGKAFVEGELACEAEFSAMLQPPEGDAAAAPTNGDPAGGDPAGGDPAGGEAAGGGAAG
jgi:3-hydroxyacyl-[acyl-carrier-protein] dehydratase